MQVWNVNEFVDLNQIIVRVESECILGFFWYLLGGGRSVENLRPLPSSKCSTWIFGCNLCCFGNISQSSINRSGTSRLAMSTSSWNSCLSFFIVLNANGRIVAGRGFSLAGRPLAAATKFLALARILCWAREPPSRSLTKTGDSWPVPGPYLRVSLTGRRVVLSYAIGVFKLFTSSRCVASSVAGISSS